MTRRFQEMKIKQFLLVWLLSKYFLCIRPVPFGPAISPQDLEIGLSIHIYCALGRVGPGFLWVERELGY